MSIAAIAEGNVAVITGGASGIGLAAARRLADLGLKVCLVDREQATLDSACATIDGRIFTYAVDVADRRAMNALARNIADELGPVSLLMNNAGIGDNPGKAWENPDAWRTLIAGEFLGRGPWRQRLRANDARAGCPLPHRQHGVQAGHHDSAREPGL